MTKILKFFIPIFLVIVTPKIGQTGDQFIYERNKAINTIQNAKNKIIIINAFNNGMPLLLSFNEADTKNSSGGVIDRSQKAVNSDDTSEYNMLKEQLKKLSTSQDKLKKMVPAYQKNLSSEIQSIKKDQNALSANIDILKSNTFKEFADLNKKTLIGNILIGSAAILMFIMILISVLVFQRKINKIGLIEKNVDYETKLSEIMKNQLILMGSKNVDKERLNENVDHSFPIKVGNEIFRMRKRIENMDESTKGIHALMNALKRLEDELNQQGYTINDLSGNTYIDELTVRIINTIERSDLDRDSKIISRMIEPQIFYRGVTVSHGEAELAVPSKNLG